MGYNLTSFWGPGMLGILCYYLPVLGSRYTCYLNNDLFWEILRDARIPLQLRELKVNLKAQDRQSVGKAGLGV